jgi:hypothetical protein
MTVKITACAMAAGLLVGPAIFSAPAAAQTALNSPSHAKRLFLSADAVYDAGLRRGRANSSHNAYLRGFRDGTSSQPYNSRPYGANQYSGNPIAVADPYAEYRVAPAAGYSLYDRAEGYTPPTRTYSYDTARSVSYDGGFVSDRYQPGYVPPGLLNVAVAPVAIAPASEARAAHWSYCATRYPTFDPASDTFLATDGNRYYCR